MASVLFRSKIIGFALNSRKVSDQEAETEEKELKNNSVYQHATSFEMARIS